MVAATWPYTLPCHPRLNTATNHKDNAILKKEKEIATLRSTIQEPLRNEIPIPYSSLLTKQPIESRPFTSAQSSIEINENSSRNKRASRNS
jgi:hypothetical protein